MQNKLRKNAREKEDILREYSKNVKQREATKKNILIEEDIMINTHRAVLEELEELTIN